MTADLLAVLREAREALESVSLALPVTQWARTIDAIGNTLARIDAALSAPEPQRWRPAPIERDESFDRDYITLPAGWEIQTKGKGSSFRVCRVERDGESYERWLVTDEHLHPVLERMAREIRKALEPPQ